MKRIVLLMLCAITGLLSAQEVLAAAPGGFVGSDLSIIWAVPFACMLLSIAIMPLAAPHFWHHHFGKVSCFWALAFMVPCTIVYGIGTSGYLFVHVLLGEYIPFLLLLFSLFTVAGGVRLTGDLVGTPTVNLSILAFGTLIASLMGTTGAAMLLIRPLLRANEHRKYQVHTVVFFIFLVANIGGSLTPLGDPPLFLGFLKGVDFFWTFHALLVKTMLLSGILLTLYFIIDTVLFKREGSPKGPASATGAKEKLGLEGKINLLLLAGIVGAVLMSGKWKPGITFDIYGTHVALQDVVRDTLMVVIALISLKLTCTISRGLNGFSWAPIEEVGKLFFGIFISMVPAIAILRAGEHGALAAVIRLVNENGQPVNSMYFLLTGLLSAFLDNAPTYLVFFNTAGGDAVQLMGRYATTLSAISAGAVFMGAVTYIGNAPNFMVLSIAKEKGVPMPSFFGYMLWSVGILAPCFALINWLFFM